jgi:hypothetical protein
MLAYSGGLAISLNIDGSTILSSVPSSDVSGSCCAIFEQEGLVSHLLNNI